MPNPRSSFPHGPFMVCRDPDFTGWNVELAPEIGGGYLTFDSALDARQMFRHLQSLAYQVSHGQLSVREVKAQLAPLLVYPH